MNGAGIFITKKVGVIIMLKDRIKCYYVSNNCDFQCKSPSSGIIMLYKEIPYQSHFFLG